MISRGTELHAATSAAFGLSAMLLFTACGADGGNGTANMAAGGSTASAGSGGGIGTGTDGGMPSGASGAGTSPAGGSPGTGGTTGAGGGIATGGISTSGGTGMGGGGGAAGSAVSGGAGSGMGGGGGAPGGGGAAGASGAGGGSSAGDGCEVMPLTADMRSRYQNMSDPYYQKYAATSGGVVVATGSQVDDEAIIRYCRLLTEMFSNESVRQPLLAEKMWFTMIDQKEQLSSLPQIKQQYGTSLDARARGLGALTPTICAEDSIMCMPGDPWVGDCICPHETGHTLYSSGIAKNPDLSKRLTTITNNARSSGRLANAYVWQDGNESGMMSWGVQAWYNCAINGTQGAYHTDINTRAELQTQLPEFYQFLSELLPVDSKYKDCYSKP